MLKKAAQQGRSERRGEEVHTALRVGRSPVGWIRANGKAPTVLPSSEKPVLNVELLSEARTSLADFFSILLGTCPAHVKPRPVPGLLVDLRNFGSFQGKVVHQALLVKNETHDGLVEL